MVAGTGVKTAGTVATVGGASAVGGEAAAVGGAAAPGAAAMHGLNSSQRQCDGVVRRHGLFALALWGPAPQLAEDASLLSQLPGLPPAHVTGDSPLPRLLGVVVPSLTPPQSTFGTNHPRRITAVESFRGKGSQ